MEYMRVAGRELEELVESRKKIESLRVFDY